MSTRISILHVVERIDDRYGGPAKSIPFTAWYSGTENSSHRIYSGCYGSSDKNSVCDALDLPYRQFTIFGPSKIAFSLDLCRAVYRFVREEENPIVHVHNSWNFVPLWVFLLSYFVQFRIVVSVRGSLFPWSLKQGRIRKLLAWKAFQKKLLLRANVVHVTSEDERDQLCYLGISKNLELIPNGVHFELSNTPCPIVRPNHSSNTPLRLLFVSRVHPKKGIDILISALSSAAIGFALELVVAGDFSDDGYRKKIESMVSALSDSVSVSFLGHVCANQLAVLYSEADLFVLPSHTENFGIVIAEALSHGLPVLTTIHTPWLEVKTRGAGYVIDNNEGALVEALIDFHQKNNEKRLEMSQNARDLIAKYDWLRVGPAYADMYERII